MPIIPSSVELEQQENDKERERQREREHERLEQILSTRIRTLLESTIHKRLGVHIKELESGIEDRLRRMPLLDVAIDPTIPYKKAKKLFKRTYLVRLLRIHAGNVSDVARVTGLRRESLHRLLRELKIKADDLRHKPDTEYLTTAITEIVQNTLEQYKSSVHPTKYKTMYKDAPELSKNIIREIPRPPKNLNDAVREWERAYLTAALEQHKHNISATARAIGLRFETLHRKSRLLRLI